MHRECTMNRNIALTNDISIWTAKNPRTGEIYLAMFNISDETKPLDVKTDLKSIGVLSSCHVVDMWSGKDMGVFFGRVCSTLKIPCLWVV